MKVDRSAMICLAILALVVASISCGTSAPATQNPPTADTTTNTAPPSTNESPPTAIPVDLTDGLVAYYPFDGNVLDTSGHGHDGQVAAPVFVEDFAGNANSALYFNGVDTIVTIPDADELSLEGSFSISMLVKGDQNSDHQWLLIAKHQAGECQPGTSSWFLRYSEPSGGMYLSMYDQSAECGTHFGYGSTDIVLNDGIWHSLALTYDQPTQALTFTLDCEVMLVMTAALNIQDNPQPLTIGNQYYGPASTNYAGVLDEVRLYNRALADFELAALCAGR